MSRFFASKRSLAIAICMAWLLAAGQTARGQVPPVLTTLFPAGGRIGESVEVTVTGSNLETLESLECSLPDFECLRLDANRFRLSIPERAQPGIYDVWAVGKNGLSSPRSFMVGRLPEVIELESKEPKPQGISLAPGCAINGVVGAAGDEDVFSFEGKKGQRIVVECWADRIDARLRPVLEVVDSANRRIAVNRGFYGTDPLIDFRVPEDGTYRARLRDLISSGGPEHYYRLEVDTGPRVAYCMPSVVESGKASRVKFYGWNLGSSIGQSKGEAAVGIGLDSVEVEIPSSQAVAQWPLPVRLIPSQAILSGEAFPYYLDEARSPVVMGVTDVPVCLDRIDNHSPAMAQAISVPCEICGQLIEGDQRDWFAMDARRGEVFWFEGLGQRIASPVDLQVSILELSSSANKQDGKINAPTVLAVFGDESRNLGGGVATNHLDPAGRWVCPEDGRYLIAVGNLSGGLQPDARRVYRLGVRREEPDFQVIAVAQPLPSQGGVAGLNLNRGGRTAVELVALRRRGWDGAIRVFARDLASGVECPDVWLGPETDRAILIVSTGLDAKAGLGQLSLFAEAEIGHRKVLREVRGGTVVRSGRPTAWGRLTSKIPYAVSGDTKTSGKVPLRLTANGHETVRHQLYGLLQARHSPGGIVDVAVQIDRSDTQMQAPIKLMGSGLPGLIPNETVVIPPGQDKAYLSFSLPPSLPVGRYSLAVRAEMTVTPAKGKPETVVVYSNSIPIDVQPAAFVVEADPFAVKQARRGETIQIAYSARRLNGFIGKMHTELAAPGCVTNVDGLRGRGETFVGQTDSGSLQIVINDDAPLGPQRFLRLFTVGVVEDEPIYHGSSFLSLEIVE